ncbi:cytochrome c [Bradyrhizobium liaoningense]|uniref:c-type cytochrome n=1 Tax=Bradyrhizobium liaoningense TaxID=43992 RepID=UPI001BAD7347|nr:cytochrome c [Bradyrhizobium liaoningense]MBR0714996.1 cytochrome c [Bradyrhizobium liaoningense]
MLKEVIGKTAAILAAVAVLAVAPLATVRAADEQNGNPVQNPVQAQIDHGKTTYAEKCSHCHGPNMMNSGTITPDLRAFPDDKTRFVTTVKQGKNNKMPPWADILSEDEITNLWAFVSSRRRP